MPQQRRFWPLLKSFRPYAIIIGLPSVVREYKGFQSPLVSAVILYFFGNGACGRQGKRCAKRGGRLAVSAGIWKLRRSVGGLPVG